VACSTDHTVGLSVSDAILQLDAEEEQVRLREQREVYIGVRTWLTQHDQSLKSKILTPVWLWHSQEEENSEFEEPSDTEEESDERASSGAESDSSNSGWNFSNSRIGNFLSTVSGNKVWPAPVSCSRTQRYLLACLSFLDSRS
jgi:hypothetical protein